MKFTIAIAAICALSQAGDCTVDESTHELGPNRCFFHQDCLGSRKCNWNFWCTGEANCDNVEIDEFAELQNQVFALEHSVADLATENAVLALNLSDVTTEVAEMREAFRLVTNIMVTEFEE